LSTSIESVPRSFVQPVSASATDATGASESHPISHTIQTHNVVHNIVHSIVYIVSCFGDARHWLTRTILFLFTGTPGRISRDLPFLAPYCVSATVHPAAIKHEALPFIYHITSIRNTERYRRSGRCIIIALFLH
jgi:hypothetical protein